MFHHLPSHLYSVIREYLSPDDELCFLHCANNPFTEWKKEYFYFTLNGAATTSFLKNEGFQQLVMGLVKNPRKQVSLLITKENYHLPIPPVHKLRYYCSIEQFLFPYLQFISVFDTFDQISETSHFSHLNSLRCGLLDHISDISNLADVRELEILSGEALTNDSIAVLGKQSKLFLGGCPGLTRVDNLRNIQQLILDNCPNIQEIGSLKGIRDLQISRCPQIDDISCLGDHYKLVISDCARILRGYNSLLNIPVVHLEYCDISDLSVLQYAREVELWYCSEVWEVIFLRNAKRVYLHQCPSIKNISSLDTVKDLTIVYPPFDITTMPVMKENCTLTMRLECADILGPIVGYTAVHQLKLYHISYNIQLLAITSFPYLQTVVFWQAFTDFSLEGLGNIHTIKLYSCHKLLSLVGLGFNRCVKIHHCPLIKDVQSLRNVPIVTIEYCSGITDYSYLRDVPRLRIVT